MNLPGVACCLTHAAWWSRAQTPEALPRWMGNSRCWGAGRVYWLLWESNRVCSDTGTPALLQPVEDPLTGRARLSLTPCLVTGSVTAVRELGLVEECSSNRATCVLLWRQRAN